MDISTVTGMLTFAATTGIITALLNQIFGIIRDWRATERKRRSMAGYHALRVAAILEGYSYACATFISDNGNAQTPPDQEFPDWTVRLPELPPYPEEAEGWHAIDLKLAGRALDLRNHIIGSQGVIWSTVEFAEDQLEYTLDQHAAERGQEAWALAVDLRRKYRLPAFEPIWDFNDLLEQARKSADKARDEQRQEQERLTKMAPVFAASNRIADAPPP